MKARVRITAAGLLMLAAMVGLFAAHPWVIDRLELSLLDWQLRLRGTTPTSDRIVLVAVDERSIDELGRWPWPRTVMAALVERLSAAGVAAIGFDIVFSEAEISPQAELFENLRAELGERAAVDDALLARLDGALAELRGDARLAAAIAASERSVLGYFFRTGSTSATAADGSLARDLSLVKKSRVAIARLPAEGDTALIQCSGVEPNLEIFERGARRIGFFSSLRDPDGVVRRVPLLIGCGGQLHVSLEVALLELLAGRRAMVLGDSTGIREIRVGDRSLPTDPGGKILVNFRGPEQTFQTLSASDVIAGRIPDAALSGKIVLLGATEVGIGDVHPAPFSTVFPGLEIHANALDNLLSIDMLRHDDALVQVELGLTLLLGLLICLVTPALRSVLSGAGLAGSLLLLLFGASYIALTELDTWLRITYPALTVLSVYITVAIVHDVTVEAKARAVRRQFATYVPPEVVAEMVDRPESFQLGGERRDLSMLFSDIRDFTTLAEEMEAEDVAGLLNAYLTPMTRIVFESRGTLDKYVGDAVIAFWGAPLSVENHPMRACEAAIEMQESLAAFREAKSSPQGASRIRIGIGIHTGSVVVGNMGSDLRFDYSLTGDGVNLCSRLEGLTKYYGVKILASEDMVRATTGILSRELDLVRVKGRTDGVRIFEILGRAHDRDIESAHLEAYALGLAAYQRGDLAAAVPHLRDAQKLAGTDGPSALLLARIEDLGGRAPASWDGIWSFEAK